MRTFAGEFLGTFALVFAGTGAIVIDAGTGGSIGHVGIALTFGLVIMAMIYAVGDCSGCHINPAVTLGFVLAGRMPIAKALPYWAAQVLGAFAASGLMRVLFPDSPTLGETIPNPLHAGMNPEWRAFAIETVLTFFLMLVILRVSTGAKEKGITAGIAIGGTIALDALFGGPISGASMNPARSLAPAVVSGHMASLWVYLTAPFLGAAIAVACERLLLCERERSA